MMRKKRIEEGQDEKERKWGRIWWETEEMREDRMRQRRDEEGKDEKEKRWGPGLLKLALEVKQVVRAVLQPVLLRGLHGLYEGVEITMEGQQEPWRGRLLETCHHKEQALQVKEGESGPLVVEPNFVGGIVWGANPRPHLCSLVSEMWKKTGRIRDGIPQRKNDKSKNV